MSYKVSDRQVKLIFDAFNQFDQEYLIKIINKNPEWIQWHNHYILNRYINEFNYLNFYDFFSQIINNEFSSEIQKKIIYKVLEFSSTEAKDKVLTLLFTNGFFPYYFYDLRREVYPKDNLLIDDYLFQVFELIVKDYDIDYNNYLLNANSWASNRIKQRILAKLL